MAVHEIPYDTPSEVAVRQLRNFIVQDTSILFVILGIGYTAKTLVPLAEAQTDTGGIPGWTRRVVWIHRPVDVLNHPDLAPFLSGTNLFNAVAFTIGFSDQVAFVLYQDIVSVTAGKVFLAYAAAEAR
jgi:hypothetical protein